MYINMTANLMVEDVAASIAFYKDVLGFEEVVSLPDESGTLIFAILKKDDQDLMVQERNSLISECPSYAAKKVTPCVTLYTLVDDFDALYEDLGSKVDLYVDKHVTSYGSTEFAISDPDGYVLAFAQQQEA